jgi:LPS sulfotransferase NodH
MDDRSDTPTTKFCIITTQRSGSTWLKELLSSHPDIIVLPELFLTRKPNNVWKNVRMLSFYEFQRSHFAIRPWNTFNYLNNLNNYPDRHKAIGFKIMYNQIVSYPEVLLKLIGDKFKIIHLVRENHLDKILSQVKAKTTNIVHARSEVEIAPVYLETKFLLNQIYFQENFVQFFNWLLKIIPNLLLCVTYESLYQNRDMVLQQIVNFLNLPDTNTKFSSSLQKINKGLYSKKIKNYQEVQKVLTGTKFEKFLIE